MCSHGKDEAADLVVFMVETSCMSVQRTCLSVF